MQLIKYTYPADRVPVIQYGDTKLECMVKAAERLARRVKR